MSNAHGLIMTSKTNWLTPKDMIVACDKALDSIPTPISLDSEELDKWGKHKNFYRLIKEMLENYFSGKPAFKGIPVENHDKELLECIFKDYLALYNVFNFGWGEIEEGFADVQLPVSSPGEALIYIIQGDATTGWSNRDKLANPKALYLAYQQFKKCKLLQEQGKLSTEEEKKLNSLIQRIKKKHPDKNYPEHTLFEDACLDICLRSKKKTVNVEAKRLQEARLKRSDNTAKKLRGLI